MGDFTSEKEQKLLESEAEVSNTEDTNADELNFEEVSGFSDDDGDSEEEEKKPKKKFIGYDKQNKKFFIGKFKIGKKLLIIIIVILNVIQSNPHLLQLQLIKRGSYLNMIIQLHGSVILFLLPVHV